MCAALAHGADVSAGECNCNKIICSQHSAGEAMRAILATVLLVATSTQASDLDTIFDR
jgi:hypothetical protein